MIFKKIINKIYPIFEIDSESESEKDDEYILKFCYHRDITNNKYIYCYLIIKNNFTIRSKVDEINGNFVTLKTSKKIFQDELEISIDIIYQIILKGLDDLIKCKINTISIQNDKYEIIDLLKNNKNKKYKNKISKFENVSYKVMSCNDNLKIYELCNTYMQNKIK